MSRCAGQHLRQRPATSDEWASEEARYWGVLFASGSPPCRLGCVHFLLYPPRVTRGQRTARRTVGESTDSAMGCAHVTRLRSVATVSPRWGVAPGPAIDTMEPIGGRSPSLEIGGRGHPCVPCRGGPAKVAISRSAERVHHRASRGRSRLRTGDRSFSQRSQPVGVGPKERFTVAAHDVEQAELPSTVCIGRLLHGGEGRPAERPTLADRREQHGERSGGS